MNWNETKLEGVWIGEPGIFRDERGEFLETYRREGEGPVRPELVQDNLSVSTKGVVRGLHYQRGEAAQAKWVMAVTGEILDVVVDLRRSSDTFGHHLGVRLSADNRRILWIPEGFAHGFSVLSDEAIVSYKCSHYYQPDAERGIRWNDPDLKIDWNIHDPTLSEKDRSLPAWSELKDEDLF